jgi:hypothetical protein
VRTRLYFLLGTAINLAAQGVKQPDLKRPDIKQQDIKRQADGSWVRTQEGSGEPSPGPRLQVSSQVRVVLRGSAGDRIGYRLIQTARARTVEVAALRLNGSASLSASPGVTFINAVGSPAYATLELSVPRQVWSASVEILRGGDIEIYDFSGSVQAHTPAGDIQGDNVGGAIVANTGGGHIRLGKMGGPVRCYTGGGSITVANAGGEVNCRTVGGEIVVKQAAGQVWLYSGGGNIAVERAALSVEAHSMEGAIQVGHAGGEVIADTRGGSIRVGSAAGIHAESASGPVHLTDGAGALIVSTAIGNILADLLAGAKLRDSSLAAVSGDITVTIPSNVAVSVMATNQMGGIPRIVSDFSEVRSRSISFARPPLAEGSIHGGGPILLLSGSGIIYLKKAK